MNHTELRVGWIGTGRMGFALAQRLGRAGVDVAAWNRTRAKAEPLTEFGVTVVDNPRDLADRDVVFHDGLDVGRPRPGPRPAAGRP